MAESEPPCGRQHGADYDSAEEAPDKRRVRRRIGIKVRDPGHLGWLSIGRRYGPGLRMRSAWIGQVRRGRRKGRARGSGSHRWRHPCRSFACTGRAGSWHSGRRRLRIRGRAGFNFRLRSVLRNSRGLRVMISRKRALVTGCASGGASRRRRERCAGLCYRRLRVLRPNCESVRRPRQAGR